MTDGTPSTRTLRRAIGACGPLALALGQLATASAQDLRSPLPVSIATEATATVARMEADPRGPYSRLRWFCADGTVHPPEGTPCRDRGGGVQHAELSAAAQELAEIGIHVGTILQSLDWDAFWDERRDHHRLKAYVIEQYLSAIDDGWVLRRARFYRGARQIEDEEAQGQAFLERLLSNPDWTRRHLLLASQLVRVVPHPTAARQASTPTVRNLATALAATEPRFDRLRAKIHSFPSSDDVDTVATLLTEGSYAEAVTDLLGKLLDALRDQYDPDPFAERLAEFREGLGPPLEGALTSIGAADTLEPLASVALRLRDEVTRSADGHRNLLLLDLSLLLHEHAIVLARRASSAVALDTSHHQRLATLAPFIDLATAAGYLSERERETLSSELTALQQETSLPALDYRERLDRLASSIDWAMSTVRSLFGPAAGRYAQVEAKATGFADAMLRSSIVLPLAAGLDALQADLNRFLGHAHTVLGESWQQGVAGLNPGVALSRLDILDPGVDAHGVDPDAIYVLPEVPSDLNPVAGLLVVGQVSLVSHVQLLARNLGIPNASIPSSLLPRLEPYRGREVFFAVSPLGRVVVKDPTRLTDDERELVSDQPSSPQRFTLSTARLRLDQTRPVALADLRATDAGVIVGPKAAHLGELAHRFPGQVPPGVALPFGMYKQHVDRPYRSGRTLHEEIQSTLDDAEALRAQGLSDAEVERIVLPKLAELRQAIVDLDWIPEMRRIIVEALQDTFGGDLAQGVFVRSDTNVEDLPEFTGAGLNLTVPHQTTEASILAAIKEVWASPLRDRPYRWRMQVLDNQADIYPSVLLLRSIHAEKSGVLITTGLPHGGPDSLTVVTAEGVGGAVEGEPAETLLVDADQIRLVSQAKAPYHRVLSDDGTPGIRWVPSSRPEALLLRRDVGQLVDVIEEWRRSRPASERSVVWDMEFGFVDEQLWLFQIRPFVASRNDALARRLASLDRDVQARAGRAFDLTASHVEP